MLALPRRLAAFAALLLAAALLLGGVQAQQAPDEADDDDEAPLAAPPAPPSGAPQNLPLQELTGQTLYDFLLGEIAAQRGSPGLAAQTFLELAKRTRDPRVARRAVEVANFARMPGVALESARIWHESDPGSAQALQAVTVLLIQSKRVEEAEPYIVKLLAPDKRYPEAREAFESILKRFPKDIDAIYAVGLLAFQVKEYGVAEANMKRLLDLGYRDANSVRFTLGQIAEEQNDWPRAIQWYDAIQRGEQALPARLRTANAIAKQGKLKEARAYLQGVSAEAEPQRVQLLVAESQLLRDANLHREAFDLLGQALQKTPDQPELLYDHALTAEKLERFEILEASLKRLIQLKPDHAHAYNALGYSFAERNMRLPEAKQLIEKALEIAPADYFIIDSLGWVLYRMGDLKGAARELRRAW